MIQSGQHGQLSGSGQLPAFFPPRDGRLVNFHDFCDLLLCKVLLLTKIQKTIHKVSSD